MYLFIELTDGTISRIPAWLIDEQYCKRLYLSDKAALCVNSLWELYHQVKLIKSTFYDTLMENDNSEGEQHEKGCKKQFKRKQKRDGNMETPPGRKKGENHRNLCKDDSAGFSPDAQGRLKK